MKATLSSSVGATDTCIPVSDTSIFSPTGGYALIGSELISYTGIGASCEGASTAGLNVRAAATAGVLTGVRRNLNRHGGAHAAGTPVIPTAPPSACIGDCNSDGQITVDELVKGVNIALGLTTPDVCPAFDCNGNQKVTVDCLVKAVSASLNGC